MYVRVLTFECLPDVNEEQVNHVYRSVVDAAQREDGFKGATLLMREDACRGMAMVFWRDKDSATAAGTTLLDVLNNKIYTMLANPPDISGYDVLDEESLPTLSS
jgi:hypothetical protein